MEFEINVNHLLGNEVTKLDKKVVPFRKNADGYDYQHLRKQLFTVIDKIGHASAKAQGLYGPITLARKLELSDHHLYVMKDSEANGGRGALVGILKVGHKRLFVYNNQSTVQELEPLCVLDFYVHESRQRMGCGRKLFDTMLSSENVKPQHLAIDRPSFKFSQFLQKHYNLKAVIPQVNNFVVFEGFFNRKEIYDNLNLRRANLLGNLGLPPVSQDRLGKNRASGRPSSGRNSRLIPPSEQDQNPSVLCYRPLQLALSGFEPSSGEENRYSRHSGTGTPTKGLSPGLGGTMADRTDPARQLTPPLLQREGTQTKSYQENFNLHNEYQDRGGHMRVGSGNALNGTRSATTNNTGQGQRFGGLSRTESNSTQQYQWRLPEIQNKSWTVFNGHNSYGDIAARNYSHTRLW
ncbi:hypothetical protein ScPMuIL_011153 [Solemya velum]